MLFAVKPIQAAVFWQLRLQKAADQKKNEPQRNWLNYCHGATQETK